MPKQFNKNLLSFPALERVQRGPQLILLCCLIAWLYSLFEDEIGGAKQEMILKVIIAMLVIAAFCSLVIGIFHTFI